MKKSKNIREIVGKWLKTNGYDGLYYDSDCGCKVDDLMVCGEPNPDCSPGYITYNEEGYIIAPKVMKKRGQKRC